MKSILPLVLCLPMASGCNRGETSPNEQVTDSSGVEIIEYGAEIPAAVERLTVESRPSVSIGKEDSGPYQFSFLRLVARARNGDFVVLDGNSLELRIFDSVGTFLRRLSRPGEGPGELRSAYWARMDGRDSIRVFDVMNRRLTTFAAASGRAMTVSWARLSDMAYPDIVGGMSDGTVLAATGRGVNPSDEREMAALAKGRFRDSAMLVRVSRDGSSLDTVGLYPAGEYCRVVFEQTIGGCPKPFAMPRAIVVADSLIYVGAGDRFEIRGYTAEGKLVRIIRRRVPPTPIPPSAIEEWQRRDAERQKGNEAKKVQSEQARRFDEEAKRLTRFPEHFPAHGEIASDRDGNLWVSEFVPFPGPSDTTRLIVFDSKGRMKAVVTIPGGGFDRPATFVIQDLSLSHVTGVVADEDDVPRVASYRLLTSLK